MKNLVSHLSVVAIAAMICACGGTKDTNTDSSTASPSAEAVVPESYDPARGEGKFNAGNVAIGAKLDRAMAIAGEAVAGTKCTACHKTSDEKLVGPGWKGVTTRHLPEWIMNFITNPDPMINKDPVVQAQLELCLVRMPNQSLTDEEARQVVEFMRKNDGVK